jgi:hypothetical protein
MKKHNFGFGINNDELLRTRNLCCTWTWKPIIFRFAINNGETTYWERENLFCTWKWNGIILRFGINNLKSKVYFYIWRKVGFFNFVCLLCPNHGVYCCTLHTIGKRSMSTGALSLFYNVSTNGGFFLNIKQFFH